MEFRTPHPNSAQKYAIAKGLEGEFDDHEVRDRFRNDHEMPMDSGDMIHHPPMDVRTVEHIRRQRAEGQAEHNALLKWQRSRPGPPHFPEEATTTGRLYMSGLVGVANNQWPRDGDGNVIEDIKDDTDLVTRKLRARGWAIASQKSAHKAMVKDIARLLGYL